MCSNKITKHNLFNGSRCKTCKITFDKFIYVGSTYRELDERFNEYKNAVDFVCQPPEKNGS